MNYFYLKEELSWKTKRTNKKKNDLNETDMCRFGSVDGFET